MKKLFLTLLMISSATLIANTNLLDNKEYLNLTENKKKIENFKETEKGYLLEYKLEPKSQVMLSIKDKILSILTITEEAKESVENNNSEVLITHSVTSLFLPHDANEASMTHELNCTILKISFLKE